MSPAYPGVDYRTGRASADLPVLNRLADSGDLEESAGYLLISRVIPDLHAFHTSIAVW
jgi:hypothetical protein